MPSQLPYATSAIYPALKRQVVLGAESAWDGVLKLEHHRAPPEDVPEFCVQEHVVTLLLGASPSFEWGTGGRHSRRATGPERNLGLFAVGARVSWRRREMSEELVAALDPAFIATLTHRTSHRGRIALHSRAGFQDAAVQHILLALQTEMRAGCPAGRMYGEALATALAIHLLQHYAASPGDCGIDKPGLQPVRLRRVLDYIEGHLDQDIGLRKLAEVAQVSPCYFATLFKQSTRLPPHRYVVRRRIAKAREMLAERRLSLAEIGYALGFPNQAHFTTMFRRVVGITPGAYARIAVSEGVSRFSSVSEIRDGNPKDRAGEEGVNHHHAGEPWREPYGFPAPVPAAQRPAVAGTERQPIPAHHLGYTQGANPTVTRA